MSLPFAPADIVSVRRRRRVPSPEALVAAQLVGVTLAVKPECILSDVRGRPEAAFARQVVMYVLNTARGLSIADVAAVVGRDRTTVAHGVRVIEERREEGRFDEWIAQIEDTLRVAPLPGDVAEDA